MAVTRTPLELLRMSDAAGCVPPVGFGGAPWHVDAALLREDRRHVGAEVHGRIDRFRTGLPFGGGGAEDGTCTSGRAATIDGAKAALIGGVVVRRHEQHELVLRGPP